MSADFTWLFLMSPDFTWPFLMSPESTEFLPVSAPAVPLIASTRTATIGASLGLRALRDGRRGALPVFSLASIKTPAVWLR